MCGQLWQHPLPVMELPCTTFVECWVWNYVRSSVATLGVTMPPSSGALHSNTNTMKNLRKRCVDSDRYSKPSLRIGTENELEVKLWPNVSHPAKNITIFNSLKTYKLLKLLSQQAESICVFDLTLKVRFSVSVSFCQTNEYINSNDIVIAELYE